MVMHIENFTKPHIKVLLSLSSFLSIFKYKGYFCAWFILNIASKGTPGLIT